MTEKKSQRKSPETKSLPITPSRRAPYDDGRAGGWVGPPPNDPSWNNWEYQQWIQDMER